MSLGSILKGVAKIALPVAGGLALGPLGGLVGGGVGKALGSLDTMDKIKIGLGGAGLISSAGQQGKANAINDQQLAQAQALDAARQQLRQKFLGGLDSLPTQRPDLGSLYQSENPFTKRPRTMAW